jgi:hypothetical protein
VPGRDSQARDGATLLCQNIKCPYPRAGAGALVREPRARRSPLEGARALERGETRSRGVLALKRGGTRSREVLALERGGTRSREPLIGPLWWAAGATAAWAVLCVRV